MKRVALAAAVHTRRIAILVLLLLALLLSAARALAPFAEGLRGELADHLGELLGMRVEVGALTVRFEGWSPRLTAREVTLRGRLSDQTEFSARELRLDVNLFATWAARALRIKGLTLVGAEIELRRDTEGRLSISGLQALKGGQDTGALAFFLREGHFALTDSRFYWTDSFAGATTIAVDIDRLVLINRNNDHLLRLDAWLAADTRSRVSARARLHGAARDPGAWAGQAHARIESQQDLMPLLQSRLPPGTGLSVSGLSLETWLHIDAGRIQDVLAQMSADVVSVSRVVASARAGRSGRSSAFTWTGLSGLLRWSRQGAVTHLRVADLRGRGLGEQPLSLGLSLSPLVETAPVAAAQNPSEDTPPVSPPISPPGSPPISPPGAARRLQGGFGAAEVALLRRLARLLAPELVAKLPPNLGHQALAGRVERLAFALDLPTATWRPVAWRIKAELADLGIEQYADWPGLRGLRLALDAEPGRGLARLGMDDGVLDLRPQLPEPTSVEQLEAQIAWRQEPTGSLRLRISDARLKTPDLRAHLSAELCLHQASSPDVDLHLKLRDADASAVGRYLPVRVLDPPLVDWLNRAVVSGRLTTGDFLLRGNMADFPFDHGDGRFVMDLEVEDATLDYSAPRPDAEPKPRWPALTDMNAEIRIVNRRLDIAASSGRFLDSELLGGSAYIPNLWRTERIFIDTHGRGPFADGRRVLLETPLEARLGPLARALEVDGGLGIALRLDVPFRRGAEVDYQGELEWRADARARLDLGEGRAPLVLHEIAGRLGFSNQGVEAQEISARLDKQPIVVDVTTQRPDGADAATRTRVEARGQGSLRALTKRFPSPFWELVTGDPRWRLAVSLSNRDFASAKALIDLELDSNLEGVGLQLPPPLGKRAASQMPLQLGGQLEAGHLRRPWLRLGPLKARWTLTQSSGQPSALRAATIAFNAEPPAPPRAPELRLSGRLPELNLGPWLDWWKRHRAEFEQGPDTLPVRSTGIAVDRVELGAITLRDLTVKLGPGSSGGTRVGFKARENAGTIDLPPVGSDAPVRVALARWRLQPPESARTTDRPAVEAESRLGAVDPRRLGPLEISVDALEWGQQPLGRFVVRLAPNGAGVDFRDLQLQGPLIDARGQGSWRSDGAADVETMLSAHVKSSNAGELLRKLQLYQGLAGSEAEILADLQWPGDPTSVELAKTRGKVGVDFGAGRLLDLEPGMGRMLGFVNLAAIKRRLSLDFRDVVDEGFSFDAATGAFDLADGLARIERFELRSSTADIEVAGTTDLAGRKLDQTVTVTPKVGSGVALASALVGGPLVGAAVLLADQVAGGAVDRLTQHQYQITGPWSEPQVRKLGLTVNDGFALSDGRTPSPTEAKTPPRKSAPATDHSSTRPAPAEQPAPSEPENLFLEHF